MPLLSMNPALKSLKDLLACLLAAIPAIFLEGTMASLFWLRLQSYHSWTVWDGLIQLHGNIWTPSILSNSLFSGYLSSTGLQRDGA